MGYRLKRAYNTLRGDIRSQLNTLDLRITTYSTLVLIVDHPGLPQSALASTLDIKRSNMAVIVDELVQLGLITRKQAPVDRRVYALFPTQTGRRRCEKALAMNTAHEQRLLKQLSADDLHQLCQLLQKIEGSDEEYC